MCQSCGNPWNRGDYHLKIKKKFKTSRINKLQKKKASPKANLNKFDQHVLQEYEKSKSYLIIQCSYCRKDSEISIGLPAKEGKVYQDTTHGVQLKKKSDKTKEEGKSLGQLAMVSKGHPIIKPVKNKHICPPKGNKKAGMGTVASKKTAQLSKKQLKTIAQGIASQKKSSPSALTAFLNKLWSLLKTL